MPSCKQRRTSPRKLCPRRGTARARVFDDTWNTLVRLILPVLRAFLAMAAGSASSERLFSGAGGAREREASQLGAAHDGYAVNRTETCL